VKTLYLHRHAKSDWGDKDLSDFERPLNKRGKKDAPAMGRHLAEKRNAKPELIISSPAKRAIKTAKAIAKELNCPKEKIRQELKIYEASVDDLLDIINGINDSYNSAMIFGHNPGFTYLAAQISDADIDNIPTCGVCRIDFDIDSWKEVKTRTGKIVFFDYPPNI